MMLCLAAVPLSRCFDSRRNEGKAGRIGSGFEGTSVAGVRPAVG